MLDRSSAKLLKAQFPQVCWLARHLDLRYQGVLQLADERVIERLPSGRFNLDHARLHYIRRLRNPERRAQKSQVDQDFIRAKTELIPPSGFGKNGKPDGD
jgi:hypothetical protein